MLEILYDKLWDGLLKDALGFILFKDCVHVSVHKYRNGNGMSVAEAKKVGLSEDDVPMFVQPYDNGNVEISTQ